MFPICTQYLPNNKERKKKKKEKKNQTEAHKNLMLAWRKKYTFIKCMTILPLTSTIFLVLCQNLIWTDIKLSYIIPILCLYQYMNSRGNFVIFTWNYGEYSTWTSELPKIFRKVLKKRNIDFDGISPHLTRSGLRLCFFDDAMLGSSESEEMLITTV